MGLKAKVCRFNVDNPAVHFILDTTFPIDAKIIFIFSASSVESEMLWLTKITRSEMGVYLCIASNMVPPSVSKRMKLQVHCKSILIFT